MMQFWIGESKEYIAAEYAKSNRSTCRDCKQKIPKDELRVGLLKDDDNFASSYWYHIECFHFKPRHKVLDGQEMIQMICGIQDLNPEDSDKVIDYLEKELKNLLENKSGKKRKSQKPDESDDDGADSQEVKDKMKTKKVKAEDKAPKQKQKAKNTKKAEIKQQPKKFMTQQRATKYEQLLQEYIKRSSQELKQILLKNNQAKTGSKGELAAKCADGKLFGRIPGCPKCAGGKLRFDSEKGSYKCPGYMEDTDFKNCGAKFEFQQIKREEWVE